MENDLALARMHVQQMSSACYMTIGLLKTALIYAIDGEEAKLATALLRSLEDRLAESREWLAKPERCELHDEYVLYVQRMAEAMEWIVLPISPGVQRLKDGAKVEAYIYVSDSDLEGV